MFASVGFMIKPSESICENHLEYSTRTNLSKEGLIPWKWYSVMVRKRIALNQIDMSQNKSGH